VPSQGDRSNAVSALAEGDATSAMFDVMIARAAPGSGKTALDLPDGVFASQIREGMNQGPGATAPHVMLSSLAAPYIYGTLFVNAVRRRGGWQAINEAWENAPSTTEQILHIDKWLAHEAPVQVPAASFATLGPGWSVADDDSEGELGVRIAFEEWMDAGTAAANAAGWGGDRGILLTDGSHFAFAWQLRFDPGKEGEERAERAFAAIVRALGKKLGRAQASLPGFVCHERTDRGPIALTLANGGIILTAGPAQASGDAWASASTCARAKRWGREIVRSGESQ
jgi:hypothetical protein